MSNCLRPHGLQHARLLCPPLSPRVCSNSRPLSWWCCLTIPSSESLFSFCLQSFPASGSFPMSRLQNIGASALLSVLPINSGLISFRIGWFYFLAIQGTLKSLLQHHNLKASILQRSAFFIVQFSHPYMTTGKSIAMTIRALSAKWHLCFYDNVMFNVLRTARHI